MPDHAAKTPTYAEFFCGGGMVRAALQDRWDCVLANDIDAMKCKVYALSLIHISEPTRPY